MSTPKPFTEEELVGIEKQLDRLTYSSVSKSAPGEVDIQYVVRIIADLVANDIPRMIAVIRAQKQELDAAKKTNDRLALENIRIAGMLHMWKMRDAEIEELRDIRDANFLEMSRLRGIAERYQEALPLLSALAAHHTTADGYCKFCMSSGPHQSDCPIAKTKILVQEARS